MSMLWVRQVSSVDVEHYPVNTLRSKHPFFSLVLLRSSFFLSRTFPISSFFLSLSFISRAHRNMHIWDANIILWSECKISYLSAVCIHEMLSEVIPVFQNDWAAPLNVHKSIKRGLQSLKSVSCDMKAELEFTAIARHKYEGRWITAVACSI